MVWGVMVSGSVTWHTAAALAHSHERNHVSPFSGQWVYSVLFSLRERGEDGGEEEEKEDREKT